MSGESINEDNGVVGSEHTEWQNLGHKIAEQIASHTTTDKNGEPVYLGREIPEEMQTKIDGAGFYDDGEFPRGTTKDGIISSRVYPNNEEHPNRQKELQDKTDRLIMDQMEEKAKNKFTDKVIDNTYDRIMNEDFPHHNTPTEAKREKIREQSRDLALRTLDLYYTRMLPGNSRHTRYVKDAYRDIFEKKLSREDTGDEISTKELEKASIDNAILDFRSNGWGYHVHNDESFYGIANSHGSELEQVPSQNYLKESSYVANELIRDNYQEIFSGYFDNDIYLSDEEIEFIKSSAVSDRIGSGSFMPNAIVNDKEKADRVLLECGVNKDSARTTALAIDGLSHVDEGQKKNISNYFKLEEKINQMMDSRDFVFRYSNYRGGRLYAKTRYYNPWGDLKPWAKEKLLDPSITGMALDRLKNASREIIDEINGDPERMAEAKKEVRANEESSATDDVIKARYPINFDRLIKIKKIDCGDKVLDYFVKKHSSSEEFSKVLSEYVDKKARTHIDAEVDVDYKKAIQDGLKTRLAKGVIMDHYERIDPTTIFETAAFKENKEKLEIDFADDEIFDLAFGGFINLLKNCNRGFHDETHWYYDNIFANDPDKFSSYVKAFIGRSNDGKTNRKLERFGGKNGNSLYYEYIQKKQRENHPEFEGIHDIKYGQIKHVNKQTMEDIVHQREITLLEKYEKNKYLKISSTFDSKTGSVSGLVSQNGNSNGGVDLPPFDFGLEKGKALLRYASFIDENLPNSNVDRFVCTFKRENKDILPPHIMDQLGLPKLNPQQKYVDAVLNDPNAYIGFMFTFEGKRCLIAESLSETAGMYIAIEDPNSGFKCLDMFDDPKSYSDNNPNVAEIDHYNRDNFFDSLDECYQKAFMVLRTGDVNSGTYKWLPNTYGPMKGNRQSWERLHNQQFPAWPMLFDNGTQMDDLAGYQEWQEQQMQNQDKLIDEKLRMWNRKR